MRAKVIQIILVIFLIGNVRCDVFGNEFPDAQPGANSTQTTNIDDFPGLKGETIGETTNQQDDLSFKTFSDVLTSSLVDENRHFAVPGFDKDVNEDDEVTFKPKLKTKSEFTKPSKSSTGKLTNKNVSTEVIPPVPVPTTGLSVIEDDKEEKFKSSLEEILGLVNLRTSPVPEINENLEHETTTTTTSDFSNTETISGDVSYFRSSETATSSVVVETTTEELVTSDNLITQSTTSIEVDEATFLTTTEHQDEVFSSTTTKIAQDFELTTVHLQPVIVKLHQDGDRRDELPSFENAPYEALMPRDASSNYTIFSHINVTYRGISENETVNVSCDPYPQFPLICEYFSIEPKHVEKNKWNGILVLQKELPSHSKAIYQVKLVASVGKHNATTTVTVVIQHALEEELNETISHVRKSHDENVSNFVNPATENKPPWFSSANVTFTVSESLPPGSVLPGFELSVTDDDLGSNAMFNLTVLDPSGLFTVEPVVINQSANISVRLNPVAKLDYEDMDDKTVVFLVAAVESFTDPPLSNMTVVTITVSDANDNIPIFNQEVYTPQIPENSPTGTVVVVVNATDLDSEWYGTAGIRYSIRGKDSQFFQVDPITGEVTVSDCTSGPLSCLDYEKNRQLAFTVIATDDNGGGLTSAVPVIIQLTDINDNVPKFNQNSYEAEIKIGDTEFVPPLFVKATDDDISSTITYIISGELNNVFDINPQTGKLSILNSTLLNVTDLADHRITLTIVARDEDNQSDTCTVNIIVEDNNSHVPVFDTAEYTANISDAILPNAVVTQVSATDEDFASGGRVSYALQYGNDGNFVIDSSTGIISVIDPHTLDYEKQNKYEIQVIAVDGGTPSQTGTANLIVNIADGNNKPPIFGSPVQRAYVKESAPLGSVIYKLSATDPDISAPELLKYTTHDPVTVFDHTGHKSRVFKKNKELFYVNDASGEVKLASLVSRNSVALVVLTVVAIDTSTEPYQTGTATLIISIVGDTNHSPIFPPPWTPDEPHLRTEVTEESPVGTFLMSLVTSDPELLQTYKIDPISPYVDVDSTTGVLITKSRIDYETIEQFSCIVTATDFINPLHTVIANVTVDVNNVNDNVPQFSQFEYHFTVEEHSVAGTYVGNVLATDDDKGIFGEISYSLTGKLSDLFAVDSNGTVTTSAAGDLLDRETTELIILKMVAMDNGENEDTRLSIEVPIFITLTDINDNPPQFINKLYETFVVPVKNAGNPVIQVVATDIDKGINGSMEYSIEEGNDDGLFWINGTTGIIYIGNKASNGTGYKLRVSARDQNGKGIHADYATVNVQISEINSHSPQFVMPYANETEVTITENKPPGVLFQVKANDLDSGENGMVSYDFVYGNKIGTNEVEHFIIDSETGEVSVKGPLDREVNDRYQLLIRAKDHGEPHSLETLRVMIIRVLDENDNQPEFPKGPFHSPYSFSVYENELVRTVVGQVLAIDPDEGENGKIFYSILAGNDDKHFVIDSDNGILRTNAILDHETKNSYNLMIKAENNNKPATTPEISTPQKRSTNDDFTNESTAVVEIRVKNTNDNPPKFIGLPYRIGVKYSAEIGDFVTRVKAVDPDGDNVTYSLMSSHLYRARAQSSSGAVVPQPFTIDKSGHIFTSASLIFYNQDRFHLTVVAREDVKPFRESKTTVEVWIYEQSQLLRVVVAFPPDIVTQDLSSFTEMLSNLTQGIVYVDDIRYHTNKNNEIDKDKTDIFIHVVDTNRFIIKSVPEVLDLVDNTFYYYPQYQQLHLTNVEPAFSQVSRDIFSPALSALIALLVVLFIGFIIVVVVCCTTQLRVRKKNTATVRRKLVSTTPSSAIENPLWIDKKLKPYEEQELSMQVFSDLLGQKTTRFHGSLGSASVVEAALNLDEEYSAIEEKSKNNLDSSRNKMKKHKDLQPQVSECSITSTSTFVYRPESPKSNGKDEKHFKFNTNGEPIMVGELL